MRRLLPAAAAAIVIGFLVWAFLPRPLEVELAGVAPRVLEIRVEEEGEARIREVFTVSATMAGKLQRISLHAGDTVVQGETVVALIGPAAPMLLDSRARAVAQATAAAAQAATDLARAQLAEAEATLDFVTAESKRAAALYERGAIPERSLDTSVRERKTAEAAVQSAIANLAVREKELESALAVLRTDPGTDAARCCETMVSPVSGRVLRVLTESEQVVQSGTPLLEIGDPGNLEVVVELLSRDAVRVTAGAEALLTGWGGTPVPARVDRVEPSAVTRVSALGISEQRVRVILALEGPPEDWQALGHGFRVIVSIVLWRKDDVLTVPVSALFRDGADWAVFVLRDGRAVLQPITLGQRNDTLAEVVKGLSDGDQVILHPSDEVVDGARVTGVPG